MDEKLLQCIIDINKAIVNISKTQESTNSILNSLIELNQTHGDNAAELAERIDQVRLIAGKSIDEMKEVKDKVDAMNRNFECIKLQMDFKEKMSTKATQEKAKKKEEISKKDIFSFISKNFPWIVVFIVILLVVFGILQKDFVVALFQSWMGGK